MDFIICTAAALLESIIIPRLTNVNLPSWPTTVLLSLSQWITVKFYRIAIYPRYFSPLKHVPGPQDSNLLYGEELNKFRASSPVASLLEWSNKWPEAPFIRYTSFVGREVLVSNSIEAVKAILQTHCYDLIKPPILFKLLADIAGDSILFVEGDQHKIQRQLMNRPFSVPNIRKIQPLFQKKASALADGFSTLLEDKPYASVQVLDVLSKATLDIIVVAALGIELENMTGEGPGFVELYNRLLRMGVLGGAMWFINAFIPIRKLIPIGVNRRYVEDSRGIRSILRGRLNERVRELKHISDVGAAAESRDLLTYLMEESAKVQKETGRSPLTEHDIIENLVAFTTAGHETSATALAWSIYALTAIHRGRHQTRLRDEVQSLLKTNPQPTFDEVSSLPFLHNFVREVLRLWSPGHIIHRQTANDLVIEGLLIPKGTQLELPPSVMHLHPKIWGENSHVFNPDRWDHLTGAASSPYAFEAFLQGPRQCPGKTFALAEIKVILVELVSRFRFTGIEKYDGSGQLMTDEEAKIDNCVKMANP